MILCGWLWAKHVRRAPNKESEFHYQPSDVQTTILADDFEVITEPDPTIREGFASLLQIQLAPKKMFVWSTSPTFRKGLRVQSSNGEMLECKLYARELGAYLNFSRMKCNRSGAERVIEVQGELFRLAFAPIRKPIEASIVHGKYWPQALHACEAATVSAATFSQRLHCQTEGHFLKRILQMFGLAMLEAANTCGTCRVRRLAWMFRPLWLCATLWTPGTKACLTLF